DPRFQVLGLRVAKDFRKHDSQVLCKNLYRFFTKKTDPTVLREALIALRDEEPAAIKDTLYELMKRYDGKDRFYLAAIGIAVGHHDEKRRDVLLADFDKHFTTWDERVANLVWELRP